MDEGSAMADQAPNQQYLPNDLIAHHILTKLPIKSLIRFKLASKQWYSTLSSDQFALTYSKLSPPVHPSSPIQFLFITNGNNYYLFSHDGVVDDVVEGEISIDNCKNLVKLGFDFDENLDYGEKLDLIGSCNGLVCLAYRSGCFFILWNPITGKFRKYSDPEFVIDYSIRVSWGFGYVSSVDDYKVIRISELMGAAFEVRVHVFSLRSRKWTRMADQLYQDIFSRNDMNETFEFHTYGIPNSLPYSFHSKQGVLVNETLYWLATKVDGVNSNDLQIVSFDLVSEEFHNYMNLELRSYHMEDEEEDNFLFVMGGCLSKYRYHVGAAMAVLHIFKSPGIVETSYLQRDRDSPLCRDIVGFTRTGKFFILLGTKTLGLVDPSSNSVKYIKFATFVRSWDSQIANFVPSLTLPDITD